MTDDIDEPEVDSVPKRDFRINVGTAPDGPDERWVLDIREAVEIEVSEFSLGELEPTDEFVTLKPAKYAGQVILVKRLVPLSPAEQQLADAVFTATRDMTW